jgi:hypothetical protein
MHFPAKGKPKKTDTMDIQRVGFAAEAVARWVGEQTEIQVKFKKILIPVAGFNHIYLHQFIDPCP